MAIQGKRLNGYTGELGEKAAIQLLNLGRDLYFRSTSALEGLDR